MASRAIAVVLGMGPTGLSIVRGLGRQGVEVYGVGLNRWEAAFSSRYCRRLWAIDPREDPALLCRKLVQFSQDQPDCQKVLYPSGDEFVAFISDHDAILRRHYLYEGHSPHLAEMFLNKKRFHELCTRCGVPTMRTEFPADMVHAQTLADSMPYPVLLKPIVYHRWAPHFGLLKGLVCADREEYLKNLPRVGPVIDNIMVQEIVEGPETNLRSVIAYIDRRGQAVGTFTSRKIRQYPPGFGTGTAVMSHPEDVIVEPSLRLLGAAGYRGLAEVEFKWCPRQQVHKALEVNIRPCRLGGLAEAAGSRALVASFLDMTGQPLPSESPQTYGIKWFFTSRDLPAVVKGLATGRFGIGDVIESYRSPRTWCVWASDDPKPFLGYFVEFAAKAAMAVGYRLARFRRNRGEVKHA